jgi:hypothetical protein
VRISSGVEKKIQRWGCPNDVATELSGERELFAKEREGEIRACSG